MKMNLRRHLRPYVTTGVAIVGTSVLLVSPPAIPTASAAGNITSATRSVELAASIDPAVASASSSARACGRGSTSGAR